ncbi:M48 family metalloprotease [Thalassotalea sp. LPB0316]|uniref:M48 family metalloprotease n=1 Tax=Thalassotalea sp. LPB0316 TaxID=2769490 RepID=UPI0018684ED8|nr:M48 family metalloprotease [Thalassotalea sp. LPB0316]QOL26480.1 M48 family metalloprotease [Thalassotalea sp. LPB0316]
MLWRIIRTIIATVLFIGLPYFIYVGFIADEPLMDVENDVDMGKRVVESLSRDVIEYPVLSEQDYPEAYRYIQNMIDEIVASDEIKYRDTFEYHTVKIIARDDVLNAFCAPGGYIYVYSGLIKYLDSKDHLAGVLGHEIAHAELRHSSIRMQKEYGRDKLFEFLIFATPADLGTLIGAKILQELMTLNYSRDQEAASDRLSVDYLQDTQYACNGAAGFFEKLLDKNNDVRIPEFLSDHPASQSRVDDINRRAAQLQCNTEIGDQSDWRAFQQMLPDAPGPEKK